MAYFVTGATGFIGRRLVERLLAKRQGKVYVLVRESSKGRLEDLIERWTVVAGASAAERVEPVIGDLRRPLLGVEREQVAELRGKVDHFFHLAAVYDMTAPAERNTAVNVGGTTHAVELARAIDAKRLHHVSSIAVAGTYQGIFDEKMFDEGQRLPSPYHRTKFESERIVREQPYVPWRVYRPGIVVGDSQTGEMDKIDGPYYFFKAIQRLRQLLPEWVPLVGARPRPHERRAGRLGGRRARAHRPRARPRRQAFHLTDPRPQRVDELINEFAARRARAALRGQHRQTPDRPAAEVAARARDALPPFKQVTDVALRELGIPREVLAHMELVPRFDTHDSPARAGRHAARTAAAAERVRGAPVGLLGARDGARDWPRAGR